MCDYRYPYTIRRTRATEKAVSLHVQFDYETELCHKYLNALSSNVQERDRT